MNDCQLVKAQIAAEGAEGEVGERLPAHGEGNAGDVVRTGTAPGAAQWLVDCASGNIEAKAVADIRNSIR